ncbi:MAG: DUF421 domain-containing protein [Actinomycetota bacterium]|nr:DUF421 domain-containing protein [Actinomycetota bacterium]
MFVFQIPVLEKILRTVAVYALILLIFRWGGRRSMAQLSTMDLVVMLLLSNVLQNAVIGSDNSFVGGAVGAITLIVVNQLIDYLCYRSARMERWFEGRSVEVVHDGSVVQPEIRRLRMHTSDLNRLVRMQNGNDIREVQDGEMDPDGHLSISLKQQYQSATGGDMAALNARLDRIERLLQAR